MSQTLEAFGRGFLDCFSRVAAANDRVRHVDVLPMSVSTITFTAKFNVPALPVDAMRLALELAQEMDEPMGFELDCDLAKRRRKKRRKDDGSGGEQDCSKRFRCQLPLKRNGKSVKLFQNGSVQSTGCASPLEFLDLMDELVRFVKHAADVDVAVVDFQINLINTLFSVVQRGSREPVSVAPGAFMRRLPPDCRAEFDPERHPAVRIPLLRDGAKVATVSVFQTGCVSIMGARGPEHVAAAYEMIVDALDRAVPEVCAPATAVRTTTAKKALCLVHGYPFSLFSCCQW